MIKHSLQFPLTLKMLLFMAVSKIKDFSNPVEIWSPRTELEPQPDPIDMLMVVGTDRVGIKKFISSKLCLLFIILSMNADVDLVCRCPEFFDPSKNWNVGLNPLWLSNTTIWNLEFWNS